MKNDRPFEILLNNNANECFKLFCIVKSLCDYPSIDDGSGYDDYDGKLYASAFAFICSDYLVEFAKMYPHEDFEGFVDEMNFREDLEDPCDLAKDYGLEYNDDFEDLIFEVIKKLKAKIAKDVKLLFPTDQLQLRLFGSIFNMGKNKEYQPLSYEYHDASFLR